MNEEEKRRYHVKGRARPTTKTGRKPTGERQ